MKCEHTFRVLFTHDEKIALGKLLTELPHEFTFISMMIRGGYFSLENLNHLIYILEPYDNGQIWIHRMLTGLYEALELKA